LDFQRWKVMVTDLIDAADLAEVTVVAPSTLRAYIARSEASGPPRNRACDANRDTRAAAAR
jgi:hypothetical protein